MASSKREKELARQRAVRQAARNAAVEKRKKQRNAVIASIVAVLLIGVAGIGAALALRGDGSEQDVAAQPGASTAPSAGASPAVSAEASAAPSGAASADPVADPGCVYNETDDEPAREVKLPPTEGVETTKVYDVTLTTDRGEIVFEMDSAKAPCTANNLRSLAHFAFYDDTPCHRLTTEGIEVLQCGDPTGTGSGGPGYQFAEENLEGATYPRGTVAMARTMEEGTNGSQFFLVYGDSQLPPNYTPFGTITAGLDVLDKVAEAGSDEANGPGDGKPKRTVQIETVRATENKG